MDVVVKGHHCTVTDSFRSYVEDKISRLEKLEQRGIRVEVKVSAERNPRRSEQAGRVEITLRSKGPVIRSEAAAEEKQAAFDMALDRLMGQLRRAADRKKVHRGHRTPRSVAQATAGLPLSELDGLGHNGTEPTDDGDTRTVAGMRVEGDGPMVVREKIHTAAPMSLDQALNAMELVGHDFYLFIDVETSRPSVVYRRKGYDYGVIGLAEAAEPATAAVG